MANTIVSQSKPGILSKSITRPVIDESVTGSGTIVREFVTLGESIIAGVDVDSIDGTLDIEIYTYDGEINSTPRSVLSWPTISTTTTAIDVRRSDVCLSRIRIICTYTDNVSFRLSIKPSAISNTEIQVVTLDTATGFSTQEISVGAVTPVQVVSSVGSKSIAVRNWDSADSTAVLYVKENATDILEGWPLVAREGISLELDEGASLYLLTDTGTIPVKILELIE